MDDNIKKSCPNCSQHYQLKSPSNPRGNIPLFLSCGHSMCETCVRNLVKFEEPLECRICFRDMNVNYKGLSLENAIEDKFYEVFPVNLYMLGEIFFQIMKSSEVQSKKDESCFIDLLSLLRNTDSNKGECMECHNESTKMCKQCSMVLCDTCFTKTHKNFIIFKNHVLQNIEPTFEPNCKIHKGKPLDYYCKDCSKSICMDCLMVGGDKSCKNHNVVSIDEVNGSLAEELHDISPKVDETYRRLTKTAVDIGHLLHNIQNEDGPPSELTQLLCNIEQHFSKLMHNIQKHKTEVVDTIVKLKCSERESLFKAKEQVANSIKKSKILLNRINVSMDPKTTKKLNYASLLDEAKQIDVIAWYLKKDEINDRLKVAVNEDLATLISDFIHLEGNANSVYRLRSSSEIPDDVEIPPPPPTPIYPPELPKDVRQKDKNKPILKTNGPVFFKEVPKYRAKSNSISSLNSADSDNSFPSSLTYFGDPSQRQVHHVQPFPDSHHPKHLHEGSQELIFVSHIVDPYNFYVQRACNQSLVKELVKEFKQADKLPKPSINHVTEGKMYLVYNRVDNMWQRCRVVSIDRTNVNKPMFHVFCIDFGSTEIVNIDKLRLLPPARVQTPLPLAANCSLANCRPLRAWATDDSYLIQKIIDNKQAIIHVRNVRATSNNAATYECDVITFEDGISIAHALVFHERAVLVNPKLPYPKISGITESPKLYNSSSDFKPKSVEEVYITYIVSPDKFFVRKRHLQTVYEKLCEDLEQEYSLSDNTDSVYLPKVGMVCVVSLDKYRSSLCGGVPSWCRCVVTSLAGRGRVGLRLPDLGAELVVHWTALRRLRHQFATFAALSTECHLTGVTPLNKKWSVKSVSLLQRFQERVLEAVPEGARGGSVALALYDRADPDDVVCINSLMVKHRFAVTFGLCMFNKGDEEEQVITKKTPLDFEKPPPKPKAQKGILSRKDKHIKSDKELEAKDKGPLRIEVKVLHYQSPSLLYVAIVHQQSIFSELFEKIQKYYGKRQTQGKDGWSVGDKCCTFCVQSKTWRRAVIIELENNEAKVFYSDFALIETVPVSTLRELTPEFNSIGDAAIKCHLCGVVSADGQDWPTITKDFLKELIDAYPRIYITKLGVIKDKSMPVELWVYHTIQGGALEPNKSEWRCLNKRIIDQGLAVPDKTQPISGTDDPVDNDMLSFLKNVTGSVSDYLLLEPIPTKPLNKETESPNSDLSSSEETDENLATDGSSNTIFISDWLPPEPFKNKEFMGMPTYVDDDGIIYLHDMNQRDTLELIRKALDVRFKDPDPKVKYTKWRVGEPCVARFCLDKRFYRGRIVDVNDEASECMVHYIDYGNEEKCSFENLRKSIALYQIPVQAHKCVLNRIRPVKDSWSRQTLDYMHKSIVEKECFIKVVDEPIEGLTPIDLKFDKLWINDHLVDFDLAVYTDGSKPIVPKYVLKPLKKSKKKEVEVVECDSGPDFIVDDDHDTTPNNDSLVWSLEGKDWNKLVEEEEQSLEGNYVAFPKYTETEFKCNITLINNLKTLELSIVHDEETDALYDSMYDEIQKEAENRSPLNGVFEYKACVALYREDNQWYRAEILQYSESDARIKVRYVDYGNVEVVSIADVRELDPAWARLPPACLAAAPHNLHVNSQLDPTQVAQQLAETLLDKPPFHAKIIDKTGPTVELRDDNGDLVYESLIHNNVYFKYSDSEAVD